MCALNASQQLYENAPSTTYLTSMSLSWCQARLTEKLPDSGGQDASVSQSRAAKSLFVFKAKNLAISLSSSPLQPFTTALSSTRPRRRSVTLASTFTLSSNFLEVITTKSSWLDSFRCGLDCTTLQQWHNSKTDSGPPTPQFSCQGCEDHTTSSLLHHTKKLLVSSLTRRYHRIPTSKFKLWSVHSTHKQ